MWYAYKGNIHVVSKELHDKYGPVVRMAPNYLDVDYASLIKTCFDVQGVWQKVSIVHPCINIQQTVQCQLYSWLTLTQTDWHAVSGAVVNGQLFYNIFSEVRAPEHSRIKKPVAKYFSPNGVAPLEPHVDVVCGILAKQFAERFGDGQSFDFGDWMNFCKFIEIS